VSGRFGGYLSETARVHTLLGGATATWPLAARAQQRERMQRIGVLLPTVADDPVFQAWVGAFLQGLALSGWTLGRNVRLDTRWALTAADIRRHAAELVALVPDVILAHGSSTVGPSSSASRFTAGAAGFLLLTQCRERPET
jgi:putative ABC transport system substrate-binding protein